MSLLLKGGIRRLSELEIDADKDWQGKGITNLARVAAGMGIGHIAQHDGSILQTLGPGSLNYVMTSQGPGHLVVWAPGGAYLWRYFPVSVYLSFLAEVFSPDHQKQFSAPLATPYGMAEILNPGWFHRLNPAISSALTSVIFIPDHSSSKSALAVSLGEVEVPIGGAVADDGGVQTNETIEAKSGPAVDQQHITGDDNYKYTTASYWEAQTFTPAASHKLRFVRLKLYRSGTPGSCTVSIKAVDGSGRPTGLDLAQAIFDGNALTEDTNGHWYRIDFPTPTDVTAGTQYAIVVRSAGSSLRWRCDTSSPAYAGGCREYSTNGGTSWTSDYNVDFMFEEYGAANDMTLLPATLAVNDAFYFGHADKFKILVLDVGQAGAGTYVLAWEYWNGVTWAALVDLNDSTDAFKNAYTNEVSHTPQGDWALTTIQGMNLYWLRARVSDAGTGYSQPLGTWARVRRDI